MDENELNAKLFNAPGYLGTFALDELEGFNIRVLPSILVVNLDYRGNQGTHWIGIAIYHKDVYICDSLGKLMPTPTFPKELVNFLHIITHNRRTHVTKQLQSDTSITCGKFVMYFVYKLSTGSSFKSFLSSFGENHALNDVLINLLYKSLF